MAYKNLAMAVSLETVIERIREVRGQVPAQRSALIAVSGIDGCGKGFITKEIVAGLQQFGLRVASINVDGWLNLPAKRFNDENPAEHFYLNALRFDDLFSRMIIPLRDSRSLRIEMDYAEETATQYRKQVCEFENVDVIVLEGIYLLKRDLRRHYDLSIWIECSFDTALERAIARGQEGLAAEETIAAYQRIYFPAQEIHAAQDMPKASADIVFVNDPKLT